MASKNSKFQKLYRFYRPSGQSFNPNDYRLLPESNLKSLYDNVSSIKKEADLASRLSSFMMTMEPSDGGDIDGYDVFKEFKVDQTKIEFSIPEKKLTIDCEPQITFVFKGIRLIRYFVYDKDTLYTFNTFEGIDSIECFIQGDKVKFSTNYSPFILIDTNEDGSYKLTPLTGYYNDSNVFGDRNELLSCNVNDSSYLKLIKDLNILILDD